MPLTRTVLGLGPRRWFGVIRLAVLALLIEAGLRVVPLPRLAQLLGVPLALKKTREPVSSPRQLRLTRIEGELLDSAWRILRHQPFNGTCLRRALIGGHILRRYDPRLLIGVTKRSGQVKAHAWVEIRGISLDPDAGLDYAILQSPMEPGA
jgi:hypothetical protein